MYCNEGMRVLVSDDSSQGSMNDTSSIFHTVGASSILHNLKNDMSVAMLESQQVNDQINAPPMVRKISDYTADEEGTMSSSVLGDGEL